jgi:hypothetical protein
MESIYGANPVVSPEIAGASNELIFPPVTEHIDEELRRLSDGAAWARHCREAFWSDFAEAE